MQNKWKQKQKDIIPDCIPAKNVKIDWKLLHQLLKYRTYSLDEEAEKAFTQFLVKYIKNIDINIKIQKDKEGNLYITKGESDNYPCIVAHQDINQSKVDNSSIIQTAKFILGIDNETGKQCGLGFDDKAGIYFALHCLKTMDNIKVFISTGEECGCIGTGEADMTFFDDCSFLIQGDRNSHENDVSWYTNGVDVVSDAFINKSQEILDKYKYDYTNCLYTDIGELVKQGCGICAINFS